MRLLVLLGVAAIACASLASAASLSVSSAGVTTDEAGTCTVQSDRDTHVDQLLSTMSFGTAADQHVKSQLVANQHALVHFNLSACSIPASATVVSAAVRLVLTTAPGTSRTHDIRRVTGAWTESTTWNTKPAVVGTASASATTGTTAGATVAWNVIDDARQWIAGTAANEGWQFSDRVESEAIPVDTVYAAREHVTATSRPQLFLVWEP